MNLAQRIKAFAGLGNFLSGFNEKSLKMKGKLRLQFNRLSDLIKNTVHRNGWFTEDNIRYAISAISKNLAERTLKKWLSGYEISGHSGSVPLRIGVIMPGNIPLAGFHDFLCVLMSGNCFVGKISSKDDRILPQVAETLIAIEPEFAGFIEFEEGILKRTDAVIATGSNNTSLYFKYYFGNRPHIIRKNRSSAAVLHGDETHEELKALGMDIFQYYGLGCRSVVKLFVPEGYLFTPLFKAFSGYSRVIENRKYANNYGVHKAVMRMNRAPFIDNGFVLLREDSALQPPPAMLYYEHYAGRKDLEGKLEALSGSLQCIVSHKKSAIKNSIPFSKSQQPDLCEYADGADTMRFLLGLHQSKTSGRIIAS